MRRLTNLSLVSFPLLSSPLSSSLSSLLLFSLLLCCGVFCAVLLCPVSGVEQCVQAKRINGGLGNVLFSTFSQTEKR